ncbi:hypothetical protein L208DRAFT_481555 [Tricholoma matsutake]|nr:hypothetical protein L208DRAFT_481555 [Tricholoma matsutake 945]
MTHRLGPALHSFPSFSLPAAPRCWSLSSVLFPGHRHPPSLSTCDPPCKQGLPMVVAGAGWLRCPVVVVVVVVVVLLF